MRKTLPFVILLVLALPLQAGWRDWLDGWLGGGEADKPAATQPTAPQPATSKAPGQQDMTRAILDALQVGVQRAIELLGKDGGYLNDSQVRIPMPDSLKSVEKVVRKLGQDKYADQFIASMNTAAEHAVPQTQEIFIDAIKGMSVQDAQAIVTSRDNAAATHYFQEKTSADLRKVVQPLVSDVMQQSGVTRAYKKLVDKAGFLSDYVDPKSLDLDAYVTEKTLDGLFLKLADEERRIRADPVARSTDILKQVFGYYAK